MRACYFLGAIIRTLISFSIYCLFLLYLIRVNASSLLQFHSDFNFFRFSFTFFLPLFLSFAYYSHLTTRIEHEMCQQFPYSSDQKTHTYMYACLLVCRHVCVYERYRLVFLMSVSERERAGCLCVYLLLSKAFSFSLTQ